MRATCKLLYNNDGREYVKLKLQIGRVLREFMN